MTTVGTGERTGVGTEVVKHCDASMNIFCLAVNRVLGELSAVYAELLDAAIQVSIDSQLLFPKKFLFWVRPGDTASVLRQPLEHR